MEVNDVGNSSIDNQIIQDKTLQELAKCIFQLNKISDEGLHLNKLISENGNNAVLELQISNLLMQNTNLENDFLKYRNTVDNLIECIDLECDLFYINEHKRLLNLYDMHLVAFSQLKKEVHQKLT